VFECYNMCDIAFTRYPKKYPYLILTVSGSLRIRYTSIRIRNRSNPHSHIYPSLSVFESESDRKYENKYNISDIRPYPIHLRYIPNSSHAQLHPRPFAPTEGALYRSYSRTVRLHRPIHPNATRSLRPTRHLCLHRPLMLALLHPSSSVFQYIVCWWWPNCRNFLVILNSCPPLPPSSCIFSFLYIVMSYFSY
jgi:hypothetical protein